MAKQKATKKEIETVMSNLIREVDFLGRKMYEIHSSFGLYLEYKKDQEQFDTFIKEKVQEAQQSINKENVNEPGETK